MVIQIRIVIDVPEAARDKAPAMIEKITQILREIYPEFKTVQNQASLSISISEPKPAADTLS